MMFRRRDIPAREPDAPYDPAPPVRTQSISWEVFPYTMEDFKARLGLADNPHDILTVHIDWNGTVEVQMSSSLRIIRAHSPECASLSVMRTSERKRP